LKFSFYDPTLYDLANLSIPLNNLESLANDVEEFLHNKFMETVVDREEDKEDDYYDREYEDDNEPFIRSVRSLSYFQGSSYRYTINFLI
jgi:hypothetical protein